MQPELCRGLPGVHAQAHLPPAARGAPELRGALAEASADRTTIVRIVSRAATSDLSSRDYEFSRVSIQDRIAAGHEDMQEAIARHLSQRAARAPLESAAHVYYGTSGRPPGAADVASPPTREDASVATAPLRSRG